MKSFQLFTSPTCQPCTAIKQEIEQLNLLEHVEVLSIEEPSNRAAVLALGVRRVPACVVDGVIEPNPKAFVQQLMELQTT